VRELERRAPEVEIVLDDCPGDTRLVASLDRGDLDACFVDLPLRFEGGLHTDPLAIDEYVLVVPRNGRRGAVAGPIRPLELRGLNLTRSRQHAARIISCADGRAACVAPDEQRRPGFVAALRSLIPRLAQSCSGSIRVRAGSAAAHRAVDTTLRARRAARIRRATRHVVAQLATRSRGGASRNRTLHAHSRSERSQARKSR
jgi:hypothetical protein